VVLEHDPEETGLLRLDPWMLDKALWLADVCSRAVVALL